MILNSFLHYMSETYNHAHSLSAKPTRFVRQYLILVLLFLPSIFASAQFDSAEVLGAIKDPSGAVVPGASVVLTNPAKGLTVTRQADASGNYDFTNVQPGEYTVTVQATGFSSSVTDR